MRVTLPASAERLWNRDFSLFFAARSTSLLGDHMLPVVISAAMIQGGYGLSGVGYALAAHLAPFALLIIFGGVLSDRFGARRMMIISDVVRLVFQSLLALLFALGTPELWQVLVLLALVGAGGATFQPGVASITPRIAPDVQRGNATLRVSESCMSVLAPSLAGVLLAVSVPWVVFAIDAATFAISGLCLFLLRPLTARGARAEGSTFRADLVEGWREFRARTWLWGVIVIWCLWQVASFGPTLTLGYSTITAAYGASALGLIMSAFGVGNLLGGLVAMRLRPAHPLRAGAIALTSCALVPLGVALGLPPATLAACYAVGGMGITFWVVMFHTSVQTQIPQDVLGRVHAYDAAGSLVMKPVGQAVAGPLAIMLGTAPVLLAASVMVLVISALLLAVPAIRNLARA
ncbi:Major Facilitator Superfamily protein [Nonomuraea solani]|uniref:Major Facilitator Superfamily protein n=1 Tax=Nonomuraea solani TaxID=1144553 RepID=A0A1H6ETU3_9ACTN|nr:MFS transporter [Nonomuraea solani]SEH00239.1 Major Facilitator Superfamily protein [Nonomuraea solani]